MKLAITNKGEAMSDLSPIPLPKKLYDEAKELAPPVIRKTLLTFLEIKNFKIYSATVIKLNFKEIFNFKN